jgi:threonine dehydratase
LLESVRNLGDRFPDARLRKVTLVRANDFDGKHARIWLALESLQVTGSFKVRGALVAVADEKAKERAIVTASAGNHGAGVAYASTILNAKSRVFVPRDCPEAKKARIARYTELVVAPVPGYDECEALAKEEASRSGDAFLSPYDDVRIVAGNGASIAFEILESIRPTAVLVPFGGGGLASGLACGFRHAGADVAVWGAQSEASAAMAMSLEKGSAITTLPAVDTLAEALEGGISEAAFDRARAVVSGVMVVSEATIARAMMALSKSGLVVEGGGACALAPVLEGLPSNVEGDIVVLLTGRNVDCANIERAARMASA